MNRKLLFPDIDATLPSPGSNVPPESALEAIPSFAHAVLPLRRKVCETTVADVKEKRVANLMSDENDVCHKTHRNRIFFTR